MTIKLRVMPLVESLSTTIQYRLDSLNQSFWCIFPAAATYRQSDLDQKPPTPCTPIAASNLPSSATSSHPALDHIQMGESLEEKA